MAGLTWGVPFGIVAQGWENDITRQARAAAFAAIMAVGTLYPLRPSKKDSSEDEETL